MEPMCWISILLDFTPIISQLLAVLVVFFIPTWLHCLGVMEEEDP